MKQYKRGSFYDDGAPEIKFQKVENPNLAQPNRINIWDLPVYVAPNWGR